MSKRFLFLMTVLALGACATSAQKLTDELDASRAAGHPVFVYMLGVDNPVTQSVHERQASTSGLGLVNTGRKAITGMQIDIMPYHMGVYTGGPGTQGTGIRIDLDPAIPHGGIPANMGFTTAWDSSGYAVNCIQVQRITLDFADGTHATVDRKDVGSYLAPGINRDCVNGQLSPDYKAINNYPGGMGMPPPIPFHH